MNQKSSITILFVFPKTIKYVNIVIMEFKQFTRSPFRNENNFAVAQQAEAKVRKFEPMRLASIQSEAKNNQGASPNFVIDDDNDVRSVNTEALSESERFVGRTSVGSKKKEICSPRINTVVEGHRIDPTNNTSQRLLVGVMVEALFGGRDHYLKGKIVRTRFNGSFDILYDNGERELGISRDLIREIRVAEEQSNIAKRENTSDRQASESADNDGPPMKIGTMLEMRDEDGKYIPAKIMRMRNDGTYDVLCQDEGFPDFGKFGVPRCNLRLPSSSVKKNPRQDVGSTSTIKTSKKNTLESSVEKQESYRSLRSSASNRNLDNPELDIGSLVEVRYRGKNKYWPGKITRKRYDGSYDIFYNDGEREICVSRELIRARPVKRNEASVPLKEIQPRNTESSGLCVGDEVEARYRGNRKYYSGKIARKRFDGTYDINYEDGDKETRVARELIIAKTAATVNGPNEMIQGLDCIETLIIGTRVKARYRGKSKFFPGKIVKCRENDRFDIRYDNDDEEIQVKRNLIVALSKEHLQLPSNGIAVSHSNVNLMVSPPKEEGAETATKLDVGIEVEALYRGKNTFYQGKITRKRYDGSFDILYIDGEREIAVSKELIRAKKRNQEVESDDQAAIGSDTSAHCVKSWYEPKSESSEQDAIFSVGTKVECRYKGAVNGVYYPGVISDIHSDTTDAGSTKTYDVQYDDGDADFHLGVENLRTVLDKRAVSGSESSEQDAAIFSVGAKVECRYKGAVNGVYYPGVIIDIHSDTTDAGSTKTYDVQYDDGDADFRLGVENLRIVLKEKTKVRRPRHVGDTLSNEAHPKKDCGQRGTEGGYTRSLLNSSPQTPETPRTVLIDLDLERLEKVTKCVSSIQTIVRQINTIDLNESIQAQDMNKFMCLINEKEAYVKKIIDLIVEILSQTIRVELFASEADFLSVLKAHHAILQKAVQCIHTVDETAIDDLKRAVEEVFCKKASRAGMNDQCVAQQK